MSYRAGPQRSSVSISMDGVEENDSEKDETKRKSRNLSEKKRRDQFNILVTELGAMVSPSNRKMDKTTVLKTTISFLKQHNEQTVRSQAEEIQEDWKPSFLSNEEFTQLMLEAIDGFILVLGTDGHILFTSESLASLLGYVPASLHNTTLYEIIGDSDKIPLYNHLNLGNTVHTSPDSQLRLTVHMRRSLNGPIKEEGVGEGEPQLELVELAGYFRKWTSIESIAETDVQAGASGVSMGGGALLSVGQYVSDDENSIKSTLSVQNSQVPIYSGSKSPEKTVFVAVGRLVTPQLLRELPVVHPNQSEFTSRHSLEWKYLFLDHRAPPIIGYLPFELLGTSGYDHYHIDDLDQVAACHENLRQTGECTSCFYRFLTKGQQWIWLQSRYYITYHQWNSKPEFIVATHKVVNYRDVIDFTKKQEKVESQNDSATERKTHSFRSGSPTLSSKSSLCGSTGTGFASSSRISQETSDTGANYQGTYRRRPQGTGTGGCSSATSEAGMHGMQIHQDSCIMSDDLSGMDDSASDAINTSNHSANPLIAPTGSMHIHSQQQQAQPTVIAQQLSLEQQQQQQQQQQPLASNSLVLTRSQQLLQQQLRAKHNQLAQLIAQQQKELELLSDQLMMTESYVSQQQGVVGPNLSPAVGHVNQGGPTTAVVSFGQPIPQQSHQQQHLQQQSQTSQQQQTVQHHPQQHQSLSALNPMVSYQPMHHHPQQILMGGGGGGGGPLQHQQSQMAQQQQALNLPHLLFTSDPSSLLASNGSGGSDGTNSGGGMIKQQPSSVMSSDEPEYLVGGGGVVVTPTSVAVLPPPVSSTNNQS